MVKQKDTTEQKTAMEAKKRADIPTTALESQARKETVRSRVKKTVAVEAKPDRVEVKAPAEEDMSDMPDMSAMELPEEEGDGKGKRLDRYFEGVGRRKTAVARVRLFTKAGDFRVNEQLHTEFFKTFDQQKIAEEALQKMKLFGRFRVSVKVNGGGSHAQAEAVRHGLARCLIKFNPDFRKRLKRADFLKRDPRMKERKKFGLKKARKAPQWAKR